LAGDQVSVAVRTEGMALSANHEGRDSATDPWAGVVESVQFLGDSMEYYVKIRNVSLRTRSDRSQNFRVGDPVFIELRSEACTIVAD
jgi:ABC-type Fe3+/spermidine/putrescine transport system ATPase subunit